MRDRAQVKTATGEPICSKFTKINDIHYRQDISINFLKNESIDHEEIERCEAFDRQSSKSGSERRKEILI